MGAPRLLGAGGDAVAGVACLDAVDVAGDAFAAGFLNSYQNVYIGVNTITDISLRDCVLAGHQLAARVLRSPGATMDTQ